MQNNERPHLVQAYDCVRRQFVLAEVLTQHTYKGPAAAVMRGPEVLAIIGAHQPILTDAHEWVAYEPINNTYSSVRHARYTDTINGQRFVLTAAPERTFLIPEVSIYSTYLYRNLILLHGVHHARQ